MLTLRQFEAGLIDVLGIDGNFERLEELEDENAHQESDENLQLQLDIQKSTNQYLEDELTQERGQKSDLQATVFKLRSQIKEQEETIQYLKMQKYEKDHLLSTC